jgi:hypothetical protein
VNGEPSALLISEPKPAAMHLLAQDPIFLFQIVDHLELLPVDPTSKDEQQELQRVPRHVGGRRGKRR